MGIKHTKLKSIKNNIKREKIRQSEESEVFWSIIFRIRTEYETGKAFLVIQKGRVYNTGLQ